MRAISPFEWITSSDRSMAETGSIRLSLLSNSDIQEAVPAVSTSSSSSSEAPGSLRPKESQNIKSLPDEADHPTCLREFLAQNKRFYVYACMTGIIWPSSRDNAAHSFTKHNIRHRLWALYLVSALFLSTLAMGIVFILICAYVKDVGGAVFCETVGIVLQNVVLYPAVIYLRRELDSKRVINVGVYTEAFDYGLVVGRRVFILCMLFLLGLTVGNAANLHRDSGPVEIFLVFLYAFLLTPTQFYLSGILTFLVMEQRVSLHVMKSLKLSAENEQLTRAGYFAAREGIDARDRHTPVNLVILSALINFVLSLLLLIAMASLQLTLAVKLVNIFYIIAIFGKQFVVLICILVEVVKVNEKCDQMIKSIAKFDWSGGLEAAECQRLALYVAAKEYPVGSTIFFIRPSRLQITIQIASMVLSASGAIFWAFAFR